MGERGCLLHVYTLCRRSMCERCDRPVALMSVIPATLALWRRSPDLGSWWAKKGIRLRKSGRSNHIIHDLYPRDLSKKQIANSRHDLEAPEALTRGRFEFEDVKRRRSCVRNGNEATNMLFQGRGALGPDLERRLGVGQGEVDMVEAQSS